MSDLISRQAAIDALHEWEMVYTWDETCLEDRERVFAPSEVIEDLPDAEPEIICCEDCKHTDGGKPSADGRYFCLVHGAYMYYCSDADMRGGENDG